MAESIQAIVANLRKNLTVLRSLHSAAALQEKALKAISNAAGAWLCDQTSPPEAECEFPSEMVWKSLGVLLESLTAESCRELIRREDVIGVQGPEVIGHIIAANTPLLPISSVVRALLVASTSFVKLPSSTTSAWFLLFSNYLREADPAIATLIEYQAWGRHDTSQNSTLYKVVDALIVYGSNDTITAIAEQTSLNVLSYGHKVSAAVIPAGTHTQELFDALAVDVLMFDQSGCLSPHTVFVEGDAMAAENVAWKLLDSLEQCKLPPQAPNPKRASDITDFLSIAAMTDGVRVMISETGRGAVLLHDRCDMYVSSTHAIIYVVHSAKEGIIEVLARNVALIQGIALGPGIHLVRSSWTAELSNAGLTYICHPGSLQMPTIHWREDHRDILRSLVILSNRKTELINV